MKEILIAEVEQFLFHEAQLLDTRQFIEWSNLFTQDARYEVPPTNMPDADPRTMLYLVNDDKLRITERAKRLTKRNAHAEFPASRTCRMISNVTARQVSETCIEAASNFLVHRSRAGHLDIYPGHASYRLRREGSLWIEYKRATLALESLRPHGKISIIL